MEMGATHLNWLFIGGFAVVMILVILLLVYGAKMIDENEEKQK